MPANGQLQYSSLSQAISVSRGFLLRRLNYVCATHLGGVNDVSRGVARLMVVRLVEVNSWSIGV